MTRRLATLACTGLAIAATPAMAEVIETYTVVPATTTTQTRTYIVPSSTDTRTYYYVTEGPQYYSQVPVTEVVYSEPAITVEAPRLSEDARITGDVMDVLATDPTLSGRIGVETYDRDVHLSGNLATPGQVRRAVRGARSVPGVDNVTHEIRPRVGANAYYY